MLSQKFEIEVLNKFDLTMCTLEEELSLPVLRYFMAYFYTESNTTKNLIMDLTQVKGERITTNEIAILLDSIKNKTKNRINGKTAIVVNNTLDRILARVTINIANNIDFPIETKIFSSICDALNWMDVSFN